MVPITSLKPLWSRSRRHLCYPLQQATLCSHCLPLTCGAPPPTSNTSDSDSSSYFSVFWFILLCRAMYQPCLKTPLVTVTSRKTPQIPHMADRISVTQPLTDSPMPFPATPPHSSDTGTKTSCCFLKTTRLFTNHVFYRCCYLNRILAPALPTPTSSST